jgi:hypothetical protein
MTNREQPTSRGTLPPATARRIIRDIHERGLQVGESLGDESWCMEHQGRGKVGSGGLTWRLSVVRPRGWLR